MNLIENDPTAKNKIVHVCFSIEAASPNAQFSISTKRHVHTFPDNGTRANEE